MWACAAGGDDDGWVKGCMECEVEGLGPGEDQGGPGERLSGRIVRHVG